VFLEISMAGYSGTPLAKKLGIKARHHVALVNAPDGFADQLEGLPDEVFLHDQIASKKAFDVIVLFTETAKRLQSSLSRCIKRLDPAGGLWIAWPKKTSGRPTDLSEPIVRVIGLETGLVDNKVCAIDQIWSGLRFVVRLKDRPAPG